MIPLRSYLIRAIYEWAVDNGLTPHLLVDVEAAGVTVPPGYARDGRLTLNIHPQAVRDLQLGNDAITLSARFSGQSFPVHVPVNAVLATYAKENGRGMFFQEEPETPPPGEPSAPPPAPSSPPPRKGPQLKRVK